MWARNDQFLSGLCRFAFGVCEKTMCTPLCEGHAELLLQIVASRCEKHLS